jgi:membrane associated rhomboid family serine protease
VPLLKIKGLSVQNPLNCESRVKIARVAASSVNAVLNVRGCKGRFTVYWRAAISAFIRGVVYYLAKRRAREGTDIG